MMGDNSTLARVLSEGGGVGVTNDRRHFSDHTIVDDKWRVLALLGKGGNGEVYRVKNIKTGLLGALKVPNSEDAHSRSRFDRELDVLQESATWQSSTASRHLPHFVDRGTVGGTNVPYFVIEFLHPLKRPTRSSAVRKVILEVCEAVGELHKNGYLHRDVKLQNLMQRDNGDVVLIDFGLVGQIKELDDPFAKRISMTQGRMSGVGSEGSAAPEQLFGHASVKSDIYALGGLASECFGGEPPRRWIPIIQKAQNSNPEYRFRDVDEFVSAIRRLVPEEKWRGFFCVSVLMLCVAGAFTMFFICSDSKSVGSGLKLGDADPSHADIAAKSKTYNSLEELKKDVEGGSSRAQFLMGVALIKGTFGEQDIRTGMRSLEDAIHNGETDACYYLGQAYEMKWVENGYLIKPNVEEAIRWYQKGCETGSAAIIEACWHRLGMIYANVHDTQYVDWSKAVEFLERVRDRDEYAEEACRTLGKIYQQGRFGVKADHSKAEERFVLAMSMSRESSYRMKKSGQFTIGRAGCIERFVAETINGVEIPAIKNDRSFYGDKTKIIDGVKYTYSIAILNERVVPPTIKRVGALAIRHAECDDSVERITLPDEIDGIPVAVIWPKCIQNNGKLKNVCLPKKIVYVDERAFEGCSNLKITYK